LTRITRHTALWRALVDEHLDMALTSLEWLTKGLGDPEKTATKAECVRSYLVLAQHASVNLRRALAAVPIAARDGRPLGHVIDDTPTTREEDDLSGAVRTMFPEDRRSSRHKRRADRASALAEELRDLHKGALP
jgi:hypothetical protein